LNYDEKGIYGKGADVDYKVDYTASVQTTVTKLSAGTIESLKITVM